MLGKHFLVNNIRRDNGKKISRHYTICNAMRPEIYKEVVRLLNSETHEDG